jgi:catechol 2,3-dioxygenase-like lactoylglutathione lyase family enzyme
MPQLRRLAITAEDPVKLATFYREVFELDQIGGAGGAVFLSDGTVNLALLPETGDAAAGLNGVGFDTVQVESIRMKLARTANADQTLVERDLNTGIEYEMHDPDGNLIGLRSGAFDVSNRHGPVPIRHIALYTPDPQRLADFYCQVLDMKEVERTDRSSIFVSDGYLNLALLYQRKEEAIGLNHFGFHVKSNEEMQIRAEKAGVRRGAARPDRIPFAEYRVHDPEGDGVDISQKGWHV